MREDENGNLLDSIEKIDSITVKVDSMFSKNYILNQENEQLLTFRVQTQN